MNQERVTPEVVVFLDFEAETVPQKVTEDVSPGSLGDAPDN